MLDLLLLLPGLLLPASLLVGSLALGAYSLCLVTYSLHYKGNASFDAWFAGYIPRALVRVGSSPAASAPPPSYSLWLSPSLSDPATSVLSSLISALPGPVFPPHATLLGEAPKGTTLPQVLQAIERALDGTFEGGGATRGKGLVVEFEDVRTGEEYFRCVLVKLKESAPATTPSILTLHHHLLSALPSPVERKPSYPHISLLYSHIPVVPDREDIVHRLYSDKLVVPVDGGVELHSPGGQGKRGEGFKEVRCDRVSVVRTKGLEVGEWEVVGEVMI